MASSPLVLALPARHAPRLRRIAEHFTSRQHFNSGRWLRGRHALFLAILLEHGVSPETFSEMRRRARQELLHDLSHKLPDRDRWAASWHRMHEVRVPARSEGIR